LERGDTTIDNVLRKVVEKHVQGIIRDHIAGAEKSGLDMGAERNRINDFLRKSGWWGAMSSGWGGRKQEFRR
jgi:hypothetical protein